MGGTPAAWLPSARWTGTAMSEARNTAETWQRRAEKAEAAIARVRELHAPHDDCPDGYAMCAGRGMCYACGTHWPCATIRILDGGDA